MTSENPDAISIEHQNVPTEHRRLHDFLYSAADEHDAVTSSVTPVVPATSDAPMAVAVWCDQAQNSKVAGVYAVLNGQGQTQYIGISRNVSLSLRSHLSQKGETVCALVTVQPFKFPKREAMAALRDEWVAALPSPPPGNVDGTWAGTIREAATQAMSAEEREAYEAKKLKLRRAMADGTLSPGQESAQANSPGQTQTDLAAAMTEDNWSALIRAQTQETRPSPE